MSDSPKQETGKSQEFYKTYGGSGPENYEKYFLPVIGGPLATDLINTAAIQPGERVLDVACGTGIVARLAAERAGASGKVAGLDINPGMLAFARSVVPPNLSIDWYESSAEKMPLPEDAFNVVLCQLGLQFIPDKLAALREMRRVLAPGGRLLIRVAGPTPRIFEIFDQALARNIGPAAAGFVDMVFSLNDTNELERLLSSAGFREVAVRADIKKLRLPMPQEFLWQYVSSTPLAALVAQADDEQRAALERDVVAKWQELVEDGALILQLRDIVAVARK